MWRSAVGAGVVVCLAMSACSGEAISPSTTSASATSGSTSPPTTGPATTTSATTTTPATTAPATTGPPPTTAAACPAGPAVPADAIDVTGISVDVDGDGTADSFQTYGEPSADRWHIRVEFGGGGTVDQVIENSSLVAPARPIGVHDIDDDGTVEAFVVVGSGAATVLIGLYDVDGCAISRITLAGAPAVFPVGATAGNVSGLTCEGVGDLERLFASRVGDDTFEGGFEPFSLDGAVLTAGIGDGAGFTDIEAAALATFDCGGLALP